MFVFGRMADVGQPTTVGVRKLDRLPLRVVSKYPQCIVWFCHKARVGRTDRRTDGRTDGQNYDSSLKTALAVAHHYRAVKIKKCATARVQQSARNPIQFFFQTSVQQ